MVSIGEKETAKIKIKCSYCNGDGWYADHSDACYVYQTGDRECPIQRTGDGECRGTEGCPIQRPCEKCMGQGYFEYEE